MTRFIPTPMPADIAPLYDELTDQLSYLYMQWKVFRQLFGTNAARVQTLNEVAPAAARVIQDALQDEVYLGLTRLTDPAIVSGKDTLSFARIASMMMRPEYVSIHTSLAYTLNKATDCSKPFREQHRNKRIAHNDLKKSLEATYTRPSREKVEEALASCGGFLNVIYEHFNGGPMAFEHVHFLGDGESLVHYLDEGLRLTEIRQRVASGVLRDDRLVNEILARVPVF